MELNTKIIPYTLRFKRPAGTSRGTYYDHKVWYVIVSDLLNPNHWGIGECAPLPDLSCDYNSEYENTLSQFCKDVEHTGKIDYQTWRNHPSILFGMETAFKSLERNGFQLWDTPFCKGEKGIQINGLIWMGDTAYMKDQIEAKLEEGYRCIKLKIGAINFDEEIKILECIRENYSRDKITIRVDANGAFSLNDVDDKLKRLSELDIHSIEQPIRAGQWNEMRRLTEQSPIPIALDEELIGINDPIQKKMLLKEIMPQYIIIKPSLHGGFKGSEEWIEMAESLSIGWWVTSALESNIGLNTIAQWCSTFNNPLPQGLGTGGLYDNNVNIPLNINGDKIYYHPSKEHFDIKNLS